MHREYELKYSVTSQPPSLFAILRRRRHTAQQAEKERDRKNQLSLHLAFCYTTATLFPSATMLSNASRLSRAVLLRHASVRCMSAGPRPVPYPYTMGAQLTQFPWKKYYDHNWLFK